MLFFGRFPTRHFYPIQQHAQSGRALPALRLDGILATLTLGGGSSSSSSLSVP